VLTLLALLVPKQYEILTPAELFSSAFFFCAGASSTAAWLRSKRSLMSAAGAQFTGFTSAKVQILTPGELQFF
jgi:hypothetical protein